MKKIFSYLKKYKWKMTLGLSLKMIGTFAELFLPLIMAHMIDNIAPTKKHLAINYMECGNVTLCSNCLAF